MEKRVWTAPQATVEQFVANEYVAACNTTKTYYEFTCDAGGGTRGGVYEETNGKNGLQISNNNGTRADRMISSRYNSFHACDAYHYAESMDDFIQNCYYRNATTGEVLNVIVWRGEDGDNVHCTTQLISDIKPVQGNKS